MSDCGIQIRLGTYHFAAKEAAKLRIRVEIFGINGKEVPFISGNSSASNGSAHLNAMKPLDSGVCPESDDSPALTS